MTEQTMRAVRLHAPGGAEALSVETIPVPKPRAGAALVRLDALRVRWDELEPSEPVRRLAEELPASRGLRAADAFQLAAALVWCKERPSRRPFVSFDNALADAAEAEGFDVHRIVGR